MSESINSRGQIIINYGEDFTSEHTLIDRHGGKRDLVCTDYAYGGKELRLIKNQHRESTHSDAHLLFKIIEPLPRFHGRNAADVPTICGDIGFN